MSKYISIEEAKVLTGKADATVRKALKQIEKSDKELVIREPYKGGYKIWVDRDNLLKHFDLDANKDIKNKIDSKYVDQLKETIEYLKQRITQLEAKNDKEREKEGKRIDALIGILGERVLEDQRIKKLK